jgi:hypothetical protein
MEAKSSEKSRKVRNDFKELSMEEKLGTLFDLEMMTLAQGFEKLGECSISIANRIFDAIVVSSEKDTRDTQQGAQ